MPVGNHPRFGHGSGVNPPVRTLLRRVLRSALRIVVGVILLGVGALFLFQDRLLWHPRPYARGEIENFSRPLEPLIFRTAEGSQTAFYAPPRGEGRPLPSSLWVLFAGNGSLVLDWDDIVRDRTTDPGEAFLLIDYPGFGRCEGHASPVTIRANVAGAMDALAQRLGQVDRAAMEHALSKDGRRLATMGQSMGTGVALEFAALHPAISRVILVSPYTSLRDASRGTVGWPLCWLVIGNFDNRARLDELARRSTPPPVVIFHGDSDTLVPQWMGRALAAAHPVFTRMISVPGADHNDTAYLARDEIRAALDGR